MEFTRLFPSAGVVDTAELLGDLGLGARAHADRPYVVTNFAATVDGRIAIDGRSGGIGDDGDHDLFRRLRTQGDALLVGTGTIAQEEYSRPIRRADLRAIRERIGLEPVPPLVTVTRSGRLPLEIPLFHDPEAHVIVYTTIEMAVPDVPARVEVVRLEEGDRPLLTGALRDLRRARGIRSVLCEGGPALLSGLLHERLVDELFLTVAPLLAGGGSADPMTTGAPLTPPDALELLWALERRGSLYLRYRVR
ncbi:RibD family protein [Conexibacter arvalis]|uniref:5-amino-6-(5-phosphoribosylamino)uracil reductase n=1 Tax=Conexibacter arvalis TaxID=912552 RepID=A0A840IJJ5_9ACTN|nr:dihydrofolate reductase family protein [Conexibacter arvalis]MBB4664343.1 5-amino-6-(5-phosphoribosylamino)uracil reductase [Conexibacter arvalis]